MLRFPIGQHYPYILGIIPYGEHQEFIFRNIRILEYIAVTARRHKVKIICIRRGYVMICEYNSIRKYPGSYKGAFHIIMIKAVFAYRITQYIAGIGEYVV